MPARAWLSPISPFPWQQRTTLPYVLGGMMNAQCFVFGQGSSDNGTLGYCTPVDGLWVHGEEKDRSTVAAATQPYAGAAF